MQFDWYQATIPRLPNVVLDAVMAELPDAYDVAHHDFGGNGYKRTALVRDPNGDTIATLLHESTTAGPNLRASGVMAPPMAELIRKNFPGHRVSRMDVAEDMSQPGLYDETVDKVREICDGSGVVNRREIRPDDELRGATYYAGAPDSRTMVRVYEKGKQKKLEAAKAKRSEEEIAEIDGDWVRVEIQYRPTKQGKSAAAIIKPDGLWGVSKWTREIAKHCFDKEIPRVMLRPRDMSDWDKTQRHMTMQYCRHVMEGGERLARRVDGLVVPNLSDVLEAYWARWKADLTAHAEMLATRAAQAEELDFGGSFEP